MPLFTCRLRDPLIHVQDHVRTAVLANAFRQDAKLNVEVDLHTVFSRRFLFISVKPALQVIEAETCVATGIVSALDIRVTIASRKTLPESPRTAFLLPWTA